MLAPRPSTLAPRPSLAVRLRIRIRGRAGADEIAVTVGAFDPRHRGPELPLPRPRQREGGALARVAVRPVVGYDLLERVRRVLERIVGAIQRPCLDLSRLLPNRDHRVAEAVELTLRLALRRLDHQRAGDGEGHRRRVETEIHQTLRDVLHLDPRGRLERARIDDALVR